MTPNPIPSISVSAFQNGNHVGDFDSMRKAARSLFIRSDESIWKHINREGKRKSIGIKSYKTGLRYTFSKIDN